jgi:2,3-diketo-5-methylthio-1-phosphopentane phosphatase
MGARKVLVSDFDGTITRRDFFDQVRRRWPRPPENDPWEKYVGGEITHFDALAEIFCDIRTTEADLLSLADSMEFDPDFARSAQALQDAGWELIVASAGCDWYIRYLLGETAAKLVVHANPGEFSPEQGLRMALPERSPFFSPTTGVNKLAIVRDALEHTAEVAFAGDGRPDLEPALLVAPAHRFARGWLADALRERGEAFHPFERWSQIVPHLLPC